LLTFARRPAPVQVTYLAYAGTTGLSTMDYRLTDPFLDPPGVDDSIYVEQSWRLPTTYWCYAPSPEAPDVSPSPAGECGNITFGCLSNFAKVTEPAIAAWTRAMQAVPNSRFVMHAPAGRHREVVVARFASAGVDASRIRFIPRGPIGYFAAYCDIDIGFDTIGYAGGTTTLDALWMGVPVITLAGSRAIGRGGVSILSNLGLTELIAADIDIYIERAIELASQADRLIKLRKELRAMMLKSALMNAPAMARDIEAAYRGMWHHHLKSEI
jgi:protein O-GlcNAc transferase